MMKYILTGFTFLTTILSIGQTDSSSYFKDFKKNKPTTEKKAKYIEVISIEGKVKTVIFSNIKTGVVLRKEVYNENKPFSWWEYFDEAGKLKYRRNFSSISYLTAKVKGGLYFPNDKSDSLNLTPPKYKSEMDIYKYLGQQIIYPEIAREAGIQGKVYIHLKIDSTGKCIPIGIFRGVHPLLDYEAYKIFEVMPNWTPAYRDGVAVESFLIFPVNFRIG